MIPARTDTDPGLYSLSAYLQWNLKQWKTDKLAGSLTHGCAASNAWAADIGTALGLFLQEQGRGQVPECPGRGRTGKLSN